MYTDSQPIFTFVKGVAQVYSIYRLTTNFSPCKWSKIMYIQIHNLFLPL
jgi:hypothetical protein